MGVPGKNYILQSRACQTKNTLHYFVKFLQITLIVVNHRYNYVAFSD